MFTTSVPTSFLGITDTEWLVSLQKYSKQYYGHPVSPVVAHQLAFFHNNSIQTSESNVRLGEEKPEIEIEVMRSLCREHCYHLLMDGSPKAYQTFVQAQPEEEVLKYETFLILSELLTVQSKCAKEVIAASSFIAMSDTAIKLASDRKVNSSDSEKFLTDTIRQCPAIYPIVSRLSKEAKELLPYAYLPDTHARHMLYTEGGNNMFATLKNTKLTKEQFDVWLGRWIINIAGFRGHEKPIGSVYLTQNTALAFLMLYRELLTYLIYPVFDILGGYLDTRATKLGLHSRYLAHLGCSLRLYTPAEGKELQDWFDTLPAAKKDECEASYKTRCATLSLTPTYEVGVLDSLRALGLTIAETLNIALMISETAWKAYQQGITDGLIDPKTTPLCFRDMAKKENLTPNIDLYRTLKIILPITIDKNGLIKSVIPDYRPAPKP